MFSVPEVLLLWPEISLIEGRKFRIPRKFRILIFIIINWVPIVRAPDAVRQQESRGRWVKK